MAVKVMVMAGGTGGHVFPALAVARELQQQGVVIVWMGTRDRMEAQLVPAAGIPMEWVTISALRGKGSMGWFLAPFKLGMALWQTLRILRRHRPQAVLGMGGFVAGPGGIASWLLRIPLLIHEQNAIAGFTNRRLAPFATRLAQAFPGAFPVRYQAVVTGNPVRAEITRILPPAQRWAAPDRVAGPLKLLILGGSQGALSLNQLIPEAIAGLPVDQRPEIWHQAGGRYGEATLAGYLQHGVTARVDAFIEDMAAAYSWADLVLCRAGALTIAELAAAGVGAILVPYPHAVDNHQTYNAHYLVAAGAAICVQQTELNAGVLQALLQRLMTDRASLYQMAQAARQLAKPEAAATVASLCLTLIKN